jgi:hypothetical protein
LPRNLLVYLLAGLFGHPSGSCWEHKILLDTCPFGTTLTCRDISGAALFYGILSP